MSEIINLRRARKTKARALTDAQANANRVAHGRTKVEKLHSAAELALSARRIDGLRLSGPGDRLAGTGREDEEATPAEGRDPQT